MPDRRSRRKEIRRTKWLDNSRRIRLYADEDIDAGAVDRLRGAGVNVLTTAEVGNTGKDDAVQAAFATQQKRVLLTRNARHFMDDERIPLRSTRGVIALDAVPTDTDGYLTALTIIYEFLVPWADIYEDMKIKVSAGGISFRFVDWKGTLINDHLTIDDLLVGRYPDDDATVVDKAVSMTSCHLTRSNAASECPVIVAPSI
jgi:hypothetical protein